MEIVSGRVSARGRTRCQKFPLQQARLQTLGKLLLRCGDSKHHQSEMKRSLQTLFDDGAAAAAAGAATAASSRLQHRVDNNLQRPAVSTPHQSVGHFLLPLGKVRCPNLDVPEGPPKVIRVAQKRSHSFRFRFFFRALGNKHPRSRRLRTLNPSPGLFRRISSSGTDRTPTRRRGTHVHRGKREPYSDPVLTVSVERREFTFLFLLKAFKLFLR